MTKNPVREAGPGIRHSSGRGLVMVITGDGKGKTIAAFGQALRAAGHGYRIFVVQFMKGRDYGEYLAVEQYLPMIIIRRSGLDSFVKRGSPSPEDIELARRGFELAREAVMSDEYDMVILDEINVAVDYSLVALEDVITLIKDKPPAVDLVLTGRYAADAIIKLADTVSEVRDIKHHYAAGITARAGIEY
ncbi:MAG: cob(I)yrinic acid a,c-diamide adenosyltransferase [delta proteobacterium MLS_D]|nr:MAG: cob(I)yrinic acid a,c-diamide adenosyltransferase [delta proteobacterium MLS_D]